MTLFKKSNSSRLMLMLSFSILICCCRKKADTQIPATIPGEVTISPSVTGTVDGFGFKASSMNGARNFYSSRTDLTFQGWMKSTGQTIYIVINNYQESPGIFYFDNKDTASPSSAIAFYEKTHLDKDYARTGHVQIDSIPAGLVMGSFRFTTQRNVVLAGRFSIRSVN